MAYGGTWSSEMKSFISQFCMLRSLMSMMCQDCQPDLNGAKKSFEILAKIRLVNSPLHSPTLTFTLTHSHPLDPASKPSLDITFKILFRRHFQNPLQPSSKMLRQAFHLRQCGILRQAQFRSTHTFQRKTHHSASIAKPLTALQVRLITIASLLIPLILVHLFMTRSTEGFYEYLARQ